MNKFKTIDNSELEDFDTECRSRGFDPKDFLLEEHDYTETQINDFIFSPNAKLTIIRKNISRTYATGNATHWVADFAIDLKNGIFK